MKFELDIVRFNTADVITTSNPVEPCECETCEVIYDGDTL